MDIAADALRHEVTDLLQRLIRLDTVNPPGNETRAAELLRDYLEANGVRCELVGRGAERLNLVARVPGGDRSWLEKHPAEVAAPALAFLASLSPALFSG